MYRNGIKRLLAVILSLGGMICLSPLLLVLCIALRFGLAHALAQPH